MLETYLSTNIAELGNKCVDHVILLPQWTLANRVSMLIDSLNLDVGIFGKCSLRDLRKLGEYEEDRNSSAKTCHCQINVLNVS